MENSRMAEIEKQKQMIDEKMKGIKRKIAVISGKGGVGKSTVSVKLSKALAESGKKCGLLDADLHGPNVAKLLGIDDMTLTREGNELVPVMSPEGIKTVSIALTGSHPDTPMIWRGPMKAGIIRQFLSDVAWGELDYMIIDLPPGTGDEPLSIIQLISALSGVVVVTTPQALSLLDARKSLMFARQMNTNVIGVIENLSGFTCPHCGKESELFGTGGGESMAAEMKTEFLGRIPFDTAMVKAGSFGGNFESAGTDKIFKDIVLKIEGILNK